MTPPRLSAEERREAIVAASIPLFAEHGFDAVTIKDIAAAAGVSEALLYRHFPGKKDIYAAIQWACINEAAEPVERLKNLADGTASLVICIYAMMWKIQLGPADKREKHQQLRRLLCRSLLSDGLFAADFMRRTSSLWVDKVRACLDVAIACGDVRCERVDAELGIWLGHHLSVMIAMYALSDTTVVDYPGGTNRLLERSVLFCLRGLGMTDEAITKFFNPDRLATLLG